MFPISDGNLPSGISINETTGAIKVDRTTAIQATTDYKISARGTENYSNTISGNISIGISDGFRYNDVSVNIGQNIVSGPIWKPGNPNATYTIDPPLPANLVFDTATGNISGSPTARQNPTEYTVRATLHDSSIDSVVFILVRVQPNTRDQLTAIIDEEIALQGNNANLSLIDTSLITDMSELFNSSEPALKYQNFNGDVSGWDVSQVKSMKAMFFGTEKFNSDISDWNTEQVTDFSSMFANAKAFRGDISGWNVEKVTSMVHMFANAEKFNGDLSGWNVSLVTHMGGMFAGAKLFDGDLSGWNVINVKDMSYMFADANAFQSDISGWNVSKVENMKGMFVQAVAFNADVSTWKVGNVTDMSQMFANADTFNANLSTWDVSRVTDMSEMFYSAVSFNADISSWNVGSLSNMDSMFQMATGFEQALEPWGAYLAGRTVSMKEAFSESGVESLPGWYVE